MTTRRPHPQFDDRGTLDWHTRFADALAAAKAAKRLVFVEMGREQCSNCRTLVQGIITQPAIAKELQEKFVVLASDIDAPEDELVNLLMANMPDAMSLPFVVFTDADGQWLDGSQGAVHPDRLREKLVELSEAS